MDKPPSSLCEERVDTVELLKTTEAISTTGEVDFLQKIQRDIAKKSNIPYRECPLFLGKCSRNRFVDGNCVGDPKKYLGCEIYTELALPSPPKGYDYTKPIIPQLDAVFEQRKLLESEVDKRRSMLERVRTGLDQDSQELKKFKQVYFEFE